MERYILFGLPSDSRGWFRDMYLNYSADIETETTYDRSNAKAYLATLTPQQRTQRIQERKQKAIRKRQIALRKQGA